MSENLLLFIINIFVFVLCGGIFMITPQLTRKSYLFGVRIPPEMSSDPDAAALRKKYMRACVIGILFLLAVCILQFIFFEEHTLLATLYMPLLVIPIYALAFVPNWKKAVRLKEERGWSVSDVRFADTKSGITRGNLTAIPWLWYIISGLIVIATVILAVYRWPYLPEEIPVHFNAAGEATRYAPPSWGYALIGPIVNAPMLILMAGVNIIFERGKLQIDSDKPNLSFAQHRIYRRRMGHAIGLMTLLFILGIAPVSLPMLYPGAEWTAALMRAYTPIMIILTTAAIVPFLIVHIRSGQGGGKIKVNIPEEPADTQAPMLGVPVSANPAKGRGDDKNWILGMFYYNPEDPALFVEDRFGSNIGFNLARLSAKVFVGVLGIGLIVLYVWVTALFL